MSDTPRTYAEIHSKDPCFSRNVVTVDANFACQLEMELNAANQRIKRLEEAGQAMAEFMGRDDLVYTRDFCKQLADEWTAAKEAKP